MIEPQYETVDKTVTQQMTEYFDYKIEELFVEFDDVYGGSTTYSLDYFPCDLS